MPKRWGSEMRASAALALALCTTLVSGCEPLENLLGIMTNGEGDAVTAMKAQDAAYITYVPPAPVDPTPTAPEPVIDPEPVVEPPPPDCTPYRWRYMLIDPCTGQQVGSYDD